MFVLILVILGIVILSVWAINSDELENVPDKELTPRQIAKKKHKRALKQFESEGVYLNGWFFNDSQEKLLTNPFSVSNYYIHRYDSIEEVTATLVPTKINEHHYIKRGIVGSIIAGPAGLIVGALTGKKDFDAIAKLEITVKFSSGRFIKNTIIDTPTKLEDSSVKRQVSQFEQTTDRLQRIINNNKNIQVTQWRYSSGKQIKKSTQTDLTGSLEELKSLLEKGVLTSAEFESKKNQILNS